MKIRSLPLAFEEGDDDGGNVSKKAFNTLTFPRTMLLKFSTKEVVGVEAAGDGV